jgi:hypothetical protein
MTVNYRPQAGGLLYNPDRDLAYCFPWLCKAVADRLDMKPDKEVQALLEHAGVTEEELLAANQAIAEFAVTCHNTPEETMYAALKRCGWFNTTPGARIAYLFYLGQVVLGTSFNATRDVKRLGDDASASMKQLRTFGRRAALWLSLTSRQRFWYTLCWPYRRYLRQRFGFGRKEK